MYSHKIARLCESVGEFTQRAVCNLIYPHISSVNEFSLKLTDTHSMVNVKLCLL